MWIREHATSSPTPRWIEHDPMDAGRPPWLDPARDGEQADLDRRWHTYLAVRAARDAGGQVTVTPAPLLAGVEDRVSLTPWPAGTRDTDRIAEHGPEFYPRAP